MKSNSVLTLLLAGLLLVTLIAGCGSSGPPPPPPIITVTISAASNFVLAGGTVGLTASADGDPANKGVTWSITPSAGAGTLSSQTQFSATYNAPATPPSSDLNVTITATSVTNPADSATANITVPAIMVSLSPSVNLVGATGTSVITATVSNDPANKGVDPASWTVACPTPPCGTLSNQTTTSATYTAPATPPPQDVQVTITATSISSPKQMGNTGITFAAIQVLLSANPTSMQATGTSTISATVNFDPASAGVDQTSWAVTCVASPCGALSGQTTTSATYTAPASPPSSDLSVTILATSVSSPKQTGSVTVTVLAIKITVSPTTALVPVSTGSVPFTAMVQNDPAASPPVNWTLTQTQNGTTSACSPGCGLVPASTTSGAPTTYTPPTSLPTSATVTVTATSGTDTTKTVNATVTLTNGTVQIVPDKLDFGSVKTNHTRALPTTVTNTGSGTLTINSITIGGTNPGEFSITTNTCGSSLSAGGNCQLTVTFKPLNPVAYNATLSITDSSSDSPQQVSLTGRGIFFRIFGSPAAVSAALTTNKAPNVPTPTGPNSVGTRLLDLVDSTRNDPFLANSTKRELLVRMWYPATAAPSCRRAEYTSQQVWNEFSRLLGVRLPQVTTNSCWDSAMADGVHPVVVFTHGYTGTFTDYTFLFEDLASRGYVVASVDHTFEATAVEFPDGRLAESVLGSHLGTALRGDEPAMDFALSVRVSDLKFVVNELELLNAGADARLAGKLDMSRVALAGHSLGGLAAILGVEEEPRFRAGIVLDGAMPKSLVREIDTPMLILADGRDTWSDDERSLWSALRGPRLAVNLQGTEHVTPSDLVWLAMGAVKTGTMGPEKTIAAIRNYVASFLDANLLGKEPDALLTGSSTEYRDAVLTTRKELLRAKY